MRLPAELTRKPREKREYQRKTDPQAAALYCMERWWFGSVVLTRTDHDLLKAVADHACRAAKAPLVEITFYRKDDRCYGSCDHEIRLNASRKRRGDNMNTLLHELGHWIADDHFGADFESHGKEFVTVYRWLLHKYRMMPFYCFDEMCRRHGVERLAKTPAIFSTNQES